MYVSSFVFPVVSCVCLAMDSNIDELFDVFEETNNDTVGLFLNVGEAVVHEDSK